jgi:exosortase/archaeosortase family protein
MTKDVSQEAPPVEQTPESVDDRAVSGSPKTSASENRKLALRFVVGFLVSVFLLLVGYRALVHAGGDRLYLNHVARSTSWVLSKAGHSSRVDLTHKDGPRVMFVAVAAPNLLLLEARKRLTEAQLAPEEGDVPALEQEVARLKEAVTQWQSAPPEERRNTKMFMFMIIPECGAMEIFAIFLAAVLAFPSTWQKRLIGIVAGLPLMYAVNIFRLACLAFIGAYTGGGKWFDFAHHFVWQGIYIIFVVAVWLGWIEWVVRRKRHEH